MKPQPERYSRRPLPVYRYTPGSDTPHPVRDRAGHSYGRETAAEPFDPSRWRDSETYLYAVDLFNAGYWWEAHESLEALWNGSGAATGTGRFLQGLIQLAAACLKVRSGNREAADRLQIRGAEALAAAGDPFAGIETSRLASEVASYVRGTREDQPSISLGNA